VNITLTPGIQRFTIYCYKTGKTFLHTFIMKLSAPVIFLVRREKWRLVHAGPFPRSRLLKDKGGR
jgi:hypothetical protein